MSKPGQQGLSPHAYRTPESTERRGVVRCDLAGLCNNTRGASDPLKAQRPWNVGHGDVGAVDTPDPPDTLVAWAA
eukprot:3493727-Pyramimonas_sp.AAC.2